MFSLQCLFLASKLPSSLILTVYSVEPILKRLATPWERTFQRHLPRTIKKHVENSIELLHKFHEAIQERANDAGVSLASLSILKTQLTNYEQFLQDLGTVLINQMNELQRDANRDFTPCVAMAMHDAYEYCAAEGGAGSYKRMKDHMEDHVERERHQMFDQAIKTVEKHLEDMCKELEEAMEAKADEISVQMAADYMRAIGGLSSNQPIKLESKEESQLRSEIRDGLSSIAVQLKPIAQGETGSQDAAAHDTGAFEIRSKARKAFHAYVEDADMLDSDEESTDGANGDTDIDKSTDSVRHMDNDSMDVEI